MKCLNWSSTRFSSGNDSMAGVSGGRLAAPVSKAGGLGLIGGGYGDADWLMREFNATPVNGRIVIALESTGSLPTVISGVEWIRQPE